MPVRPLPPSASSTTPAGPTRSARCTTARPSWTGWSRSRSAASPSPRRPPPASGATARSTSSTRRATWTSRPRSSAACACWTARWRCSTPWRACSRSRKRCGARRTSTRFRESASSTRWTGWAPTSSSRWKRIVSRLKCKPVPIQIPIGSEDQFKGVVDLVEMKARIWRDETLGAEYEDVEIPEDLLEQARQYHEQLMEAVSECDEQPLREVRPRARPDQGRTVPGHPARHHRAEDLPGDLRHGVQEQGRPEPAGRRGGLPPFARLDVPPVQGTAVDDPEPDRWSGSPPTSEPFSALVFKIMTDPFVGQLAFLRVYSGSAAERRYDLQRGQGPPRARRPPGADARQQARGDPGDLRRRHRRRRGAAQRSRPATRSATRRRPSFWSRSTSRRRSSSWPSSPRPRPIRRSWARPSAS